MDAFNLVASLWPTVSGDPSNTVPTSTTAVGVGAPLLQSPFFGQIRISPTTKLVDGNFLPTAAVADVSTLDAAAMTDLLNCLNASTSASTLATTTRLFESRCSTEATVDDCGTSATSAFIPPAPASAPIPSNVVPPIVSISSIEKPEPHPVAGPATSAGNLLDATLSDLIADGCGVSSSSDPIGSTDSKNVPLCQVCSDRASGFHYGVTSCEGCKGFFRRSIQQKIQYRPCAKNQQCAIVRNNRNRCQFCRLKKCLEVGMSRDAVRFGRVPKREKVKMEEEMQRASARSYLDSLRAEIDDDRLFAASIRSAFADFGEALRRELLEKSFIPSDGPFLNWTAYSSLVKAVVRFAESVRGFRWLYAADRIQLLKNAFFPLLLVRLCSMNGNDCRLLEPSAIASLLFLDSADSTLFRSSVVEFIQHFRLLGLDETQMGIFGALVLCQSDAGIATVTHLQQAGLAKLIQEKLWILLQNALFPNAEQLVNSIHGQLLVQSLFNAFSELRQFCTLHRDHLQRCYVSSNSVKVEKTPTAEEIRQRHKAIVQVLEQPSMIPQMGDDEDSDQPLNLCVRDEARCS